MLKKIFQWRIVVSILVLFLTPCAWADTKNWGNEWDAIANQPDANVIVTTSIDGDQKREIRLQSGVVIDQLRYNNGEIQNIAIDKSGHGAVMCAWDNYTDLRAAMNICLLDTPSNKKLKSALDDAISRINDFIVANSLAPITMEALRKAVNTKLHAILTWADIIPSDELMKKCAVIESSKLFDQGSLSPQKIKLGIDDLLSVPRPPVSSPCY